MLTADQQAYNAVHGALRALGERANSLLKTTFKVLRRYRGCPWCIGDVVAAALVLLAAGLWLTRRAPRTNRARAAFALWGGWLVVTGLVFSFMQGIFHAGLASAADPKYTVVPQRDRLRSRAAGSPPP